MYVINVYNVIYTRMPVYDVYAATTCAIGVAKWCRWLEGKYTLWCDMSSDVWIESTTNYRKPITILWLWWKGRSKEEEEVRKTRWGSMSSGHIETTEGYRELVVYRFTIFGKICIIIWYNSLDLTRTIKHVL
jgi:hypothetical protein